MCRELLCWSTRFEIAVTIRKSNHPICVRDVQKLRCVTGWIKGHSEWFVQIVLRKNSGNVGFAIAVRVAQYLYLIRATFYDENVAIRCAEEESRITKTTGIQFDFEPGRNLELDVGWPGDEVGPVNNQRIRTWWRQILHCDFTCDTGRVASPIVHRGFARENYGFFSGGCEYDRFGKNRPENNRAVNWIT